MLNLQQIEALKLHQAGQSASAIAQKLGVSSRTIERWRQLPEYQQKVAKAQDAIAIHLGSQWVAKAEQISNEHFDAHNFARNFAMDVLRQYRSKFDLEGADETDVRRVVQWSVILDRAIAGERVACNLEQLSINRAFQLLQSNGYIVLDPNFQDVEPE